VRKITAEAQADLDALFTSEKLTAAGKALAQLLQDDSFQKLPERQREHIAGFYATAIAIEKETEALKLARKEREDQDEAFESARQRHATDVKQLKERIDQYTQSNRLLSFEIDLVGQDESARPRLAATMEYETLARDANELGAESELDALQEQLQERLRLIDDLAAKVKEFNNTEQIRSIFADSFSDEISQVISGTKSLSDAFRDMERQIVQSISRIAAQNIADAVFGKSGSAGGFGDFAKWLGSIIPSFAGGTNYAPGGMALVGERGPEIINIPRGSKVTPNDRIGGNVISINVNVPGGTSRASADQIALQTGIAVKRAVARIG
jgi:hypothetical protein